MASNQVKLYQVIPSVKYNITTTNTYEMAFDNTNAFLFITQFYSSVVIQVYLDEDDYVRLNNKTIFTFEDLPSNYEVVELKESTLHFKIQCDHIREDYRKTFEEAIEQAYKEEGEAALTSGDLDFQLIREDNQLTIVKGGLILDGLIKDDE